MATDIYKSVKKSEIKTRVQYKSKIEFRWTNKNMSEIIEPTYVSNVIIDRDFDNTNAPIIYMIANLPTTLCNRMVSNQKTASLHLKISHYNILENNPAYEVDIDEDFSYIMPTNTDTNEEIAQGEIEHSGIESAYSRLTIGLLNKKVLDDNRKTLESTIYRKINKTTLVYLGLKHVKKLCINNISDKDIDSFAMPTMSSVNDYLKYIDEEYSIYKLGYRYFHDFDITYLLNESGTYIPNGKKEFKLVTINIDSNIAENSNNLGMHILSDSYQIDVSSTDSDVTIDKNTISAVTQIVQVDDVKGKINTVSLKDKEDSNQFSTEKIEYIRDTRNASRIRYDARKYEVCINISKAYIDDELFTPNKVYKVSNYKKYKDHDGRYILYRKQTVYENKDGEFIPTTSLSLRKKVEEL